VPFRALEKTQLHRLTAKVGLNWVGAAREERIQKTEFRMSNDEVRLPCRCDPRNDGGEKPGRAGRRRGEEPQRAGPAWDKETPMRRTRASPSGPLWGMPVPRKTCGTVPGASL
jgi:hypothetical protein